ncbi:N-methyl-L-tryptophan oxidase [Leifsonia sp. 2TAF2]|uniref:N-methyl-L-tryptophan oxidase n=1 Tax=Leifsonia sp. 2TAF2 TaxID=3233009 RepID=UPI003F95AEAA
MDAQVGVIGLGAAGSAALWRTAARGAEVIGFEQFGSGHDRGSSHGYSRVFKSVTPQGPQESALAQRAAGLWRELEEESGESVLHMTGGLSIGKPDSPLIAGLEKVAAETGLPLEYLDEDEVRRRFPQHVVTAGDIAVIDPASGYIQPELAIRTEWKLAQAHGARVVDAAVLEVIPQDESVLIVTAERTYEVGTAIVAAGAWQRQLLPFLPLELTPRRATLSWFAPKPGKEALFTPEAFPAFTHEAVGETGWGLPEFDEFRVKIGLDFTEGYEIVDPSANRKEVEDWELARVRAFVAETLPDLDPVPVHSGGCMITMTPDEEFTIGIPAEHPRLVVLSACSGRGFKMSAAVGDVGAELALTGTSEADLSIFSPDRFANETISIGATK